MKFVVGAVAALSTYALASLVYESRDRARERERERVMREAFRKR